MLLVPRQLMRSGMTGNVPYYGGRLTPGQAYAAAHPSAPPLSQPSTGRVQADAARPASPPSGTVADSAATESSLRQLRDSGVISPQEYDDLLGRVHP